MHNKGSELVILQNSANQISRPCSKQKVLLVRPPYFTPWTPPLGIAILKSFLNENGHHATCFDFNADPELWGMHHKYFSALAAASPSTSNDGYSKLWWIINAHMLAYANGAGAAAQRRVIETISPLYGIRMTRTIADCLVPLIERYFARLSHLFDQLDLSSYDVIGTSTYTTSLSSSLWVLKRAKEQRPEIKTVMGGGVFADDLALGSDNLQILLNECPWIDHVVLGEGEMLFKQILDGALSHKRVVSIADLAGQTMAIGNVPTPDFSDFDLERYYNLTIEGARSCPFQCSFCSETIQWGDYRKKPVEKFVEQVLELKQRHGIREFFMGDSLMNPYLIPFADALMKQNANILYDGYLRADRPVTNKKFVNAWAASGLYRVRLGIESASIKVLNAMDKKTTPQVISEVLKTLAEAGIRTTTYWIVGFPGETEQDFQETCDFIRANYRNIYELEAHPYYYYPYGQVGSRLYQCESVYPDEITNLTKFKVWEIIGANPPREVRYQRLDRISALAKSLGIPNIYTMTERYEAEDRWRALHPMAGEVYPAAEVESPIADSPTKLPIISQSGQNSLDAVVSYKFSVARWIDPQVLAQSLALVIGHHSTLRMEDAGTHYRVESTKQQLADPVRFFDNPASADAGSITTIVNELAHEIAAPGPVPFRLGVLERHAGNSDLVLVGHRRFLDSASLILMAEDISRTYEQILASKEPFLPAVRKSYSEYVHGHAAGQEFSISTMAAPSGTMLIERELSCPSAQRVSPDKTGLWESSVRFITAASRSLAMAGISSAAVVLDPRLTEKTLGRTVGALSRIVPWPASLQASSDVLADIKQVQLYLNNLCSALSPLQAGNARKCDAVINVEFLVPSAWIGSEHWRFDGFVVTPTQWPLGSGIQIVPTVTPDGVVVKLFHEDTPDAQQLACKLESILDEQIAIVVQSSEAFGAAEEFWLQELGVVPPLSQKHIGSDKEGYEYVELDPARLAAASGADTQQNTAALLAAYSLQLSRIDASKSSQLVMLYPTSDEHLAPWPLRLIRTGNPMCSDFMRTAREKLELAQKHVRYSAKMHQKHPIDEFTLYGCISRQLSEVDPDFARLCADDPYLQTFDIVLDPGPENAGKVRIFYRPGTITKEIIESIAAAIPETISRMQQIENLRVADVLWIGEERAVLEQEVAVPELSLEFEFSN